VMHTADLSTVGSGYGPVSGHRPMRSPNAGTSRQTERLSQR